MLTILFVIISSIIVGPFNRTIHYGTMQEFTKIAILDRSYIYHNVSERLSYIDPIHSSYTIKFVLHLSSPMLRVYIYVYVRMSINYLCLLICSQKKERKTILKCREAYKSTWMMPYIHRNCMKYHFQKHGRAV